jgi:hypothetical protein
MAKVSETLRLPVSVELNGVSPETVESMNQPGRKTSEWKAWLTSIAASLAIALGYFITLGLVADKPGIDAYDILSLSAGALALLGGVNLPSMKYSGDRSRLKTAFNYMQAAIAERAKAEAEAETKKPLAAPAQPE